MHIPPSFTTKKACAKKDSWPGTRMHVYWTECKEPYHCRDPVPLAPGLMFVRTTQVCIFVATSGGGCFIHSSQEKYVIRHVLGNRRLQSLLCFEEPGMPPVSKGSQGLQDSARPTSLPIPRMADAILGHRVAGFSLHGRYDELPQGSADNSRYTKI